MRIIDCLQRSEEWERLRARPTASEFYRFITPARGDYSKQSTAYAAVIVAKRLGLYVEPPPSFWMEWGVEHEPAAREAYQLETGRYVEEVGFIVPDDTDAFGGSPDGIVESTGLLEIKCPAPETLISYHAAGELPDQYRPQIQGLLLISGMPWCDFYVWHPELKPFLLRVHEDTKYQGKIAQGLVRLLAEIDSIEEKLRWKV